MGSVVVGLDIHSSIDIRPHRRDGTDRSRALPYDGCMAEATEQSPAVGDATRSPSLLAAPRLLALLGGLAGAVVVADQATKAWIRGWLDVGEHWLDRGSLLNLSHVENTGAAFGILRGNGMLLIIPVVIAIGAVLLLLVWAPQQRHGGLYSAALALILGGAIGNLIDRVARGSVTDFIDPIHYPAFNLADSAIVIGVIALVGLSFLEDEGEEEGEQSAEELLTEEAS